MANRIIVDIITGPCPGPDGCPVTVTFNNTNVCIDATGITIAGTCFIPDPNAASNTVTFNLGAVGVVTSATATSLTVIFSVRPTAEGTLTVVVNNGNGPSNGGVPVQVATIIPACGPGCSFSRIPQPTYNSDGMLVSVGAAVGVTCGVGELLVVKVTLLSGDWNNAVTVTWNGQPLTLDNSKSCSGLGFEGKGIFFSCATLAAATDDVTVMVDGSIGAYMTIQPIRLVGSATNAADIGANASGGASAPDSGATGGTAADCEIAEALIFRIEVGTGQPTWLNDFVSGGHIVQADAAGASEGWKLLDTAGSTADAAITEEAAGWAALVEVYR